MIPQAGIDIDEEVWDARMTLRSMMALADIERYLQPKLRRIVCL